ncbi:MAG: beta-galactosidase, partial [bacterium]|nr:beta-galactosidase [bacterium]
MGFSSGKIQAQSPTVVNISSNWKFQKGDFEEAFKVNFNDSKWETVTVPHDWAIYGPFDKNVDIQKVAIVQNGEKVATEKTGRTGALPHIGIAWYRNKFTLPKDSKGKKIILLFEGAMSEPQVYLNGKK